MESGQINLRLDSDAPKAARQARVGSAKYY